MIELTSLMTGASSADSRISATSARSSSLLVDGLGDRVVEAVHAADQGRDVLGEATTGRTSWPVISLRSSSASTFDGSAIATISAPSSPKPIGTALKRRAACALIRLSAAMSALKTPRSTWCEPEALGDRARDWSTLIAPDSSSSCSGVRPAALALLDRGVDPLARDEAELDDDVGDEARAAPCAAGA